MRPEDRPRTLEPITFDAARLRLLRPEDKPCGLLNINGCFEDLPGFLDHASAEDFLRRENRATLLDDTTPAGLIGQFERCAAPRVEKRVR